MAASTTFKARNNQIVSVDEALWSLAQGRVAAQADRRLHREDAFELIAAVDDGGDLADQKRTLRHIRRYFRWTEAGGKALLTLMSQGGAHRWTAQGRQEAIAALREELAAG